MGLSHNMNIASPSHSKWSLSSSLKYWLIATVGFIVMVVITIIVLGITTDEMMVKDQSANHASQSSIFDTLKTSGDFFKAFDKPKTKPKPTPKKKPKPKPKPVPKPVPKITLKFNDLFNHIDTSSQEPINNVAHFLNRANRSSQTRTFRKYEDFEASDLISNDLIETIETHYSSAHSKASFPVDFSRTLTADRNIYAIMINDINSQLQGKVVAQIESNIYAAQGRFILIPAGSKAIGYYNPAGRVGDTRLQILWSRMITPKGVDIMINAELADQMGRSGLAGEVDTRFWDKYGATLLFSTINAIGQYKVNTDKNQSILANTYGKDLANISASTLADTINIKPIISINAGTRISISLLEDVWFRAMDGQVSVQPLSRKSPLF
jgi:type IV secretory pathway VirB10-like protein